MCRANDAEAVSQLSTARCRAIVIGFGRGVAILNDNIDALSGITKVHQCRVELASSAFGGAQAGSKQEQKYRVSHTLPDLHLSDQASAPL